MSDTQMVVLVDTNVWLDNYLPGRPHEDESRRFFDVAVKRNVDLVFPASIVKDVFYLVANEYKRTLRERQGQVTDADAIAINRIAWGVVDNMSELATPVGMDVSDIWLASKWRRVDKDLEDNLVRAAAKRAKVDMVVTWDKGMLSKALVPTVTPQIVLAQLEGDA